jgi:hypothetical protein
MMLVPLRLRDTGSDLESPLAVRVRDPRLAVTHGHMRLSGALAQIAFTTGSVLWLIWTYHKGNPPTGRGNALVPLEVLGPHVRVLPEPHGDALIRTEETWRTRLAHGGDVRIAVGESGIGLFGVTRT